MQSSTLLLARCQIALASSATLYNARWLINEQCINCMGIWHTLPFHATQNDGTVQATRTLSQIATLRLLKSSPRNDWAHSSLVDDYPSITTLQLATLNCKDCTLSFAIHPGGLHVWNRPTG